MQPTKLDLSQDCFIVDRDQDEYLQLPQVHTTPKINHAEQSFLIEKVYQSSSKQTKGT